MDEYPGLSRVPWYESSQIELVATLEDAFEDIRAEVEALGSHGFHHESERIARSGDWDVLMLFERGRKHSSNCERCPVTTTAIEAHQTVRTLAGLAYVSRMRGRTRIASHRGTTNLRLRCHLALRVPEGDCALKVGDETRGWQEGCCLVFDDYFEHEAWNETDSDRVVLVVDVWHPDLDDYEIVILEGLHRYAAAHAEVTRHYWEANARARARAYH